MLRRPGHTEAAVDLARMAGLQPAGAICEIVSQKDEGAMAQTDELRVFADEHDLALIAIADLIEWRRKHEKHIERIAEARIRPGTGSSAPLATPASTRTSSMWRWSGVKSRDRTTTATTCWSGCTRNA